MQKPVLPLLAAWAALLPVAAHPAPVVLELFTSQACSSCPPADALLAVLAHRPDIIALDLHVDYWNGAGWRDPFAAAQFTARQQWYADRLGTNEVYTPELVINGHQGVVGSDERAVAAAIAAAHDAPSVPIRLRHDAGGLVIEADATAASTPARLWLAGLASTRSTQVRGGENGGRTLDEADVVLSLAPVGQWTGQALHLTLPTPPGDRAVAFLQRDDGLIIGAAASPRRDDGLTP